MAGWNGSGTFSRTHDWTEDQGNGIKIRADRHDDNDVDFVSGINNTMTKDGQNSATADLNMGGNKLKNGKTATLVGDFPIVSDIQNAVQTFITSTGSANAYLIALSPAPAAYVAGQKFTFKANFANTGAATLNVNSLGAKAINLFGTLALVTNQIIVDQIVTVVYDGTQFQATSISSVRGDWETLRNVTISNDTTVEFEDGVSGVVLDSTFDEYRIMVKDYVPATNAQNFLVNFSVDGGATTELCAFMLRVTDSNGSNNDSISGSVADVILADQAGNAAGEGYNIELYMGNLNSALFKNIYGSGASFGDSASSEKNTISITVPSASAVDSITFKSASGNMTSGSLILQGRTF